MFDHIQPGSPVARFRILTAGLVKFVKRHLFNVQIMAGHDLQSPFRAKARKLMPHASILILVSASLSGVVTTAHAGEGVAINLTDQAALLDGRCGDDEWDAGTKIKLPAETTLYLMQDNTSFFICAKGAAGDTTVLDLFIEHPETGHIHKFHLSAQMGEEVFTEKGWSDAAAWQLEDWTGFWVPYFGYQETEEGRRPKFYRDSDRQVQVLRKKFPGDRWNMMFVVSLGRDGVWTDVVYPKKAANTDKSTWGTFLFSE